MLQNAWRPMSEAMAWMLIIGQEGSSDLEMSVKLQLTSSSFTRETERQRQRHGS
jgi:hypothetical protein